MYTLVITFYLSLLGALLMIWLKKRELSSGNASLVSKLGTKSDHIFHAIFGTFKTGSSLMNKKSMIMILSWVTIKVLAIVRKVYVEIKFRIISNPHGKKMLDAVRGRGEINSHGASFYLRRISPRENAKTR